MKGKVIGVIVVLVIVLMLVAGVGYASLKGSTSGDTTTSSSSPQLVNSGTLAVICTNCSGGNPNNYQWSGSIGTAGASSTYDGNGTQSYTLHRGSDATWIVSWAVQKSTTGGTLELRFTLDNGTIAYDQNTTASYGVVSGSWSYQVSG